MTLLSNVDGNLIIEQQSKTYETLEELKGRMSKLEDMFFQIISGMDKIGTEVKQIRDLQEPPKSAAELDNSEIV